MDYGAAGSGAGLGGAAAQGGKRQMFLYMYSQERSNS